jgi:hypothetical protein
MKTIIYTEKENTIKNIDKYIREAVEKYSRFIQFNYIKYLAVDEDNSLCGYSDKPIYNEKLSVWEDETTLVAFEFLEFIPTGIDFNPKEAIWEVILQKEQ